MAIQELKRGTNANAAVSTAEKSGLGRQDDCSSVRVPEGDNDGDDL